MTRTLYYESSGHAQRSVRRRTQSIVDCLIIDDKIVGFKPHTNPIVQVESMEEQEEVEGDLDDLDDLTIKLHSYKVRSFKKYIGWCVLTSEALP